MKNIITEEMRLRKRIVEYAIEHDNNAAAARRYHTSRQNVKRWRDRYDGSWESIRNQSRRPHSHPNQHTANEHQIIKAKYQRYGHEGLAEVYVQCQREGYSRSYDSMCKQIREQGWNKSVADAKKKYPKSRWKPTQVTYPGEKVQIDIKYVPMHCLKFDSKGIRYYQITAIDEYSRKRYCEIVDEKTVTNTALFLLELEACLGFDITKVQTDNGREFTNDPDVTDKLTIFEEILESKEIEYLKTRPYSPWQNGIVERSHREDGERFYNRREFKSVQELKKAHRRYVNRGNNIHRKVLNFKSPNEVVREYFRNKPA
ncbi:DDE-type integrase/transposase/recombinase [Facklamia sp. P12955]|uniref:DDE-type integrase/transposase/recombinase n=1 Tax=Facklamia sp. P12955 TaxID=3421946 RepID=UPI003D1662CB